MPHTLGIFQVAPQIEYFERSIGEKILSRTVRPDGKGRIALLYHQLAQRLATIEGIVANGRNAAAERYRGQIFTTVESPVFQLPHPITDDDQREMPFLIKWRIAVEKSAFVLQLPTEIEGFERTIVKDGFSGRNALITVAAYPEGLVAVFKNQIFQSGAAEKGRIADFDHRGWYRERSERRTTRESPTGNRRYLIIVASVRNRGRHHHFAPVFIGRRRHSHLHSRRADSVFQRIIYSVAFKIISPDIPYRKEENKKEAKNISNHNLLT